MSSCMNLISLFFSFARHKLIKWWCQSFLVCIPVVTCGFRNDHGIVNRLTDYPTAKLPSIGANFWLPNVCMNLLSHFISCSFPRSNRPYWLICQNQVLDCIGKWVPRCVGRKFTLQTFQCCDKVQAWDLSRIVARCPCSCGSVL